MSARQFSNKAVATTLAGAIGSGDTTISLGSTSGFPASFPYTLVIEPGSVSQEVVTVTALAGSVATVTRGQDGSTAVSHGNGVDVKHQHTARDFQEPQTHFDTTTGVHGVGGGIVMGTTLTQTVKNKTFIPPDVASTGIVVQGLNGQTAALQQWKDFAGAVGAYVSATFALVVKGLQLTGGTAGVVPFTLTAAPTPTVDQFQIFDSTPTKKVWVDSTFGFHAPSVATTAITGVTDLTITGNLSAVGGSLSGALAVTGAATVGGNATVTGSVTAANVKSTETTGGSSRSAAPYGHLTQAAQTVADTTLTTLNSWTLDETTDTNFGNTSGSFTVPVNGVYDFYIQVYFGSGYTGGMRLGIKKGSNYVGRTSSYQFGGSNAFAQTVALGLRCTAGDVITADIYQNSGGNLLVGGGGTAFVGRYVHP